MTIRVNGVYRVGHKLRNVFNGFRMVRRRLVSVRRGLVTLPLAVFRLLHHRPQSAGGASLCARFGRFSMTL